VAVAVRDIVWYTPDFVNDPNAVNRIFEKTLPSEFSCSTCLKMTRCYHLTSGLVRIPDASLDGEWGGGGGRMGRSVGEMNKFLTTLYFFTPVCLPVVCLSASRSRDGSPIPTRVQSGLVRFNFLLSGCTD